MRTNRLRLAWPALLLFISLLLAGCNGDYLFQDRFDHPQHRWGRGSEETFTRGYEEGEYFIAVTSPDLFVWSQPGRRFDDTVVEVTARPASRDADGHFGLLCRYHAPDSFYYFGITTDGYYAILRVEDGEPQVLTGDGFLPSSHVRPRDGVYYIRAVCQGDELSLYVAGQEVATVTDDGFSRGDVGLGVGSGPASDIRVYFDNLVVTAPGEGE